MTTPQDSLKAYQQAQAIVQGILTDRVVRNDAGRRCLTMTVKHSIGIDNAHFTQKESLTFDQ
ncbi:hypothetical protein N9J88_07285 [Porticoccaceae bacterium]|nr:hypothetical protein [Porticoccaceae bacterium]